MTSTRVLKYFRNTYLNITQSKKTSSKKIFNTMKDNDFLKKKSGH